MDIEEFTSKFRQTMEARDRAGALGLIRQHREVAIQSAQMLANQGRAWTEEGRGNDAYSALTTALNIYEQLEDIAATAHVRNDLAKMYLAHGELHMALAAARDARDDFDRIEYRPGLSMVAATLVDIYGSGISSQRRFLKQHLRYAKERNLHREIARTEADLEKLSEETG